MLVSSHRLVSVERELHLLKTSPPCQTSHTACALVDGSRPGWGVYGDMFFIFSFSLSYLRGDVCVYASHDKPKRKWHLSLLLIYLRPLQPFVAYYERDKSGDAGSHGKGHMGPSPAAQNQNITCFFKGAERGGLYIYIYIFIYFQYICMYFQILNRPGPCQSLCGYEIFKKLMKFHTFIYCSLLLTHSSMLFFCLSSHLSQCGGYICRGI